MPFIDRFPHIELLAEFRREKCEIRSLLRAWEFPIDVKSVEESGPATNEERDTRGYKRRSRLRSGDDVGEMAGLRDMPPADADERP